MENVYRRYKRPESVLVVIYTRTGEVLLLQRRKPEGYWQSVTGSLEWDEMPRQAACRELVEETGLSDEGLHDCKQKHRFTIFAVWRDRYAPDVTENTEHVFRLQIDATKDIKLDESEHKGYRWFPKAEAAALASSYTNRDAILTWVPGRP